MLLRKLISFLTLLFLFFTCLSLSNFVVASSPKKIDANFYQDVYNSSKDEIVIIKFREESAVSYSKRNLTDSAFLFNVDNAYAQKLYDYQMDWVKIMKQEFPFTLIQTYQQVYNGIAIMLRGYNIRYVLADSRVERVYDTRSLNYLCRQFSVNTISAKPAWNLETSNKEKITGKGMRVGILDTGIDYFHPDFLDAERKASKIKGGKDFADNDDDFYDSGSTGQPGFVPHGTHVSGITSGNNISNSLKKGMAPDSDLYIYKVFSDKTTGANSANVIAAINQSVVDKCHVINLSLGNASPVPSIDPGNPYYDSILNAMKAGVVVVCAAGNDGSRNQRSPYTIGAPGTYEPAIQVAGSDDRMNTAFKLNLPDGTNKLINCRKFFYTPPFNSTFNGSKIVDCGFGRVDDFSNIDVKGKIALISRGPKDAGVSFQEKNLNAKKAGAIGAITYNYDEESLNGTLVMPDPKIDPYSFDFIPNLQMSGANAFVFNNALANGGSVEFPTNTSLSMYDMSSVGPCYSGDDNVFKPEISAPGKQVNSAVMSARDDKNNAIAKYEDWDGTSMATPHVTGAIALIRQAHPSWDSFDIKAVVMNSSDIIQNQVSGLPFSFFAQGAGQINTLAAIQSPMITTPPSFMRNIAKLADSYEFEIKNTSTASISVTTSFEIFGESSESNPVQATFSNQKLTLTKGEKNKFTLSLTVDETKFVNRRYEGVIWIQSGNIKHHIPVILYKGKLSDPDKPITNFRISESTMDIKNPAQAMINFEINAGSRLIIKGIDPEMDSTSNVVDTFKIYVTDSKKNIWGTIFFGENLFIGKYSFVWNGLDIYGKEIVPNGTYYLMAEISGLKITVEGSQEPERLPMPENSELIPVLIQESSVPVPPLLLISCSDKIKIDNEFVIEIMFADAQDIDEVQLKLTWSKTAVNSVSYEVGNFVNTNSLDEKKDIQLADGVFVIIAKRDPGTESKSRLKIATIRLSAEKATGKNGLISSVEVLQILDKQGNNRKTLLNYPVIQIVKTGFDYGDFNNDGLIDQADLDLLLSMNQKTYTDTDWDPKYDLNNDLMIDISDFVIFSRFFEEG
jgi:minor extracellular serine protease Vpr